MPIKPGTERLREMAREHENEAKETATLHYGSYFWTNERVADFAEKVVRDELAVPDTLNLALAAIVNPQCFETEVVADALRLAIRKLREFGVSEEKEERNANK